VPPLWRLEVANGFQSAIRRKRIDQRYRDDSLAELRLLPIEIDSECDTRVWSSALPPADQFGLSVYDACYLELAQRRDLPLATLVCVQRARLWACGRRRTTRFYRRHSLEASGRLPSTSSFVH
jgi:hypothetical protein